MTRETRREHVSPGPVQHPDYPLTLGAIPLDSDRTQFRVWAPAALRVEVHLVGRLEGWAELAPQCNGYFEGVVKNAPPGAWYFFRLDVTREFPDPAARFQPMGVNQPSEIVSADFPWDDDAWRGIPLKDYVLYELHVGTFTPDGTFDAVIDHLDELVELGVTAVEIMPVSQFPGNRNWGYDGVHHFAAQNTYGGPAGLKRLVNACHLRELAVVMDVVYNHLGPEGNYLSQFGPYFSDRHYTPWGPALNFDGPHSDAVRRFFIENALYWLGECHCDALRLDAVQTIVDQSANPFLKELADAARALGELTNRRVYTIAETNQNDARLNQPAALGGYGLDAHWSDDLHHALHVQLTGERSGYYADFTGIDDLAAAYRDGFVYTGQYSHYRRRRHGNSPRDLPASAFVVCSQNHDQVGNRMRGERLSNLVSLEQLKLAAGVVLLSPYIPLLFMGEEYGEPAPFQYFVSHLDPGLVEAVRRGRKAEYKGFGWYDEPPDPQDEATFERSKLNHALRHTAGGAALREFYRQLIHLRRTEPTLVLPDAARRDVWRIDSPAQILLVRRWTATSETLTLFHFGEAPTKPALPIAQGTWVTVLDSADVAFHGPGSPFPAEFTSTGLAPFAMPPHAMALFRAQ